MNMHEVMRWKWKFSLILGILDEIHFLVIALRLAVPFTIRAYSMNLYDRKCEQCQNKNYHESLSRVVPFDNSSETMWRSMLDFRRRRQLNFLMANLQYWFGFFFWKLFQYLLACVNNLVIIFADFTFRFFPSFICIPFTRENN